MRIVYIVLAIVFMTFSANSKEYYWRSSNALTEAKQTKIDQWLANGVNSTKSLFKTLPQDKLYFWVDIKANAKEPVPWGQVTRDDYNSIYLNIDNNASLKALIDDWTLYHEIAHIYLPFLEHKSTWLGEGFATYVQNVTMLHAGIHSPSDFIRKIKAGFGRGIKNSKRVKGKIERVSQHMRRHRAYMKVYWTGAAFFLEADIKLQKQNKNLINIISTYAHCCLTDNERGDELMTTLDSISKTTIFSKQYQEYKNSMTFPVVSPAAIEQASIFYSSIGKKR